ncbi:MAG: SHOCT domain-containing protein [Rhodoblastus sp.]
MSNDLIKPIPARLTKALAPVLQPGEVALIQLKGAFKEALICTDRRVIIVKGGFMVGNFFGNNVFQLPYANVASVEVKFHFATGYFEVSAGGMQNTSKSYWSGKKHEQSRYAPNCVTITGKPAADDFNRACAFILDRAAMARNPAAAASPPPVPSGAASAIEHLAMMRDRGLVTADEFEAKRKELLARI